MHNFTIFATTYADIACKLSASSVSSATSAGLTHSSTSYATLISTAPCVVFVWRATKTTHGAVEIRVGEDVDERIRPVEVVEETLGADNLHATSAHVVINIATHMEIVHILVLSAEYLVITKKYSYIHEHYGRQ